MPATPSTSSKGIVMMVLHVMMLLCLLTSQSSSAADVSPLLSLSSNRSNSSSITATRELELPSSLSSSSTSTSTSIKRAVSVDASSSSAVISSMSSTSTGEEFTMETILENESNNPWCIDAHQCDTSPTCSGSNIILRPCDASLHDTQLFVSLSDFLYVARQMGFCLEVNASMQLTVVYCNGGDVVPDVNAGNSTDTDKTNNERIRTFEITEEGKLIAVEEDTGKRYAAKLKFDPNDDNDEIYKIEFTPNITDPSILTFNQVYHPSCEDSPLRGLTGKVKKSARTCEIISKKSEKYCKWKKFQTHCPATCGYCNEYGSSDSIASFVFNQNVRDCKWLRNLFPNNPFQVSKFCQKPSMKKTCRKTCSYFVSECVCDVE